MGRERERERKREGENESMEGKERERGGREVKERECVRLRGSVDEREGTVPKEINLYEYYYHQGNGSFFHQAWDLHCQRLRERERERERESLLDNSIVKGSRYYNVGYAVWRIIEVLNLLRHVMSEFL